ncbi:MAG TPA: TetR/AcrR family transcriptional regulator [Aeromicrobium sp.]|nr:TetR/AcrR family transcriptional regulator [Aeromicrobium sp.]
MSGEVLTERRERILEAAARHFADQPYERVSTVAIANDADVNRGWIYHEFGSKRDLYLAVLRRTVRTPSLPALAAQSADAEHLEQAIAGAIATWLDEVDANRSSYLLMYQIHSGSRSDPVIRGILRELHLETIDNALHAFVPDAAEASPAARAMIAAFGEVSWHLLWEWLESGRLSRSQVELILIRSIVTLFDLLSEVLV